MVLNNYPGRDGNIGRCFIRQVSRTMLKQAKIIFTATIGEFDMGYLKRWLVIALLIGVAAG